MANLKRNLIYNGILTVTQYLFPLLTFPYITRVLGAENLGVANYALSIVDYSILLANLGLATVGVKAIASCTDNKKTSEVFSQLVSIHIVLTTIVSLIYLAVVFCLADLADQKELLLIGLSRLFINVVSIEWFYQGVQNFKYITTRSIIVRSLYVFSVFVFVRSSNDYDIYFILTILQYVVNSVINWFHSRDIVRFKFTLSGLKVFSKPLLTWGATNIVLSLYTTFNVMYLGYACTKDAVGYYTTSVKLYAILLSLLTAYNTVFVPHINAIYSSGNIDEFKRIISKSFATVISVSVPIIIIGMGCAKEIIHIIAGQGFDRSIVPFQIIIIQLLLVGISQVTETQILLTLGKNREVFKATLLSAILSLIIILLFTSKYAELASAYAVAIPHVIECLLLLYYSKLALKFSFPWKYLLNTVLTCIPMLLFIILSKYFIGNVYMRTFMVSAISIIYYIFIEIKARKNDIFINMYKSIKQHINL